MWNIILYSSALLIVIFRRITVVKKFCSFDLSHILRVIQSTMGQCWLVAFRRRVHSTFPLCSYLCSLSAWVPCLSFYISSFSTSSTLLLVSHSRLDIYLLSSQVIIRLYRVVGSMIPFRLSLVCIATYTLYLLHTIPTYLSLNETKSECCT